MKDRKLAARYARALLAVLPDPASAEAADGFLAALGDAIESSAELRDVMLNPATPHSARKGVLFAIAEAHGASRIMKNFLGTVADHGRVAALPAIAQVFREEREAGLGVVPATLTTAVVLPADLRERVAASLEQLSGRKVRLTVRVDPALVGGAVTRIGSTVFDGSVKTQLNRLHRRMAEE